MYKESLSGHGKIQPLPHENIERPDSDEELESQANQAVRQYTKQATGARHQLGRGLPADHEALQ